MSEKSTRNALAHVSESRMVRNRSAFQPQMQIKSSKSGPQPVEIRGNKSSKRRFRRRAMSEESRIHGSWGGRRNPSEAHGLAPVASLHDQSDFGVALPIAPTWPGDEATISHAAPA